MGALYVARRNVRSTGYRVAVFPKTLQSFVRRQRWLVAIGLAVLVMSAAVGLAMGGAGVLLGLGVVVVVAALALSYLVRRRAGGDDVSFGRAAGAYVAAALVIGLLIQLVPYGRDHSNPAIIGEPAWASPRTRELMVNACFGCHSNEVEWPWYSNIAPVSWVVTMHVDEGRDEVNYSEFATNRGEAEETLEVIKEGEMPPAHYTAFGLHPEAKLSEAELAELVAGLTATPGLADGD
jgi:hypothetical protein